MSASEVASVTIKLENHIVPVTDVDRAKGFYQQLGWRLDDDVAPMEGLRFVQFTPPGSPASITFGLGLPTGSPGGIQATLVVSDIEKAHDELLKLGIDVSDVWHGPPFPVAARQPGPDPERASYGSFCSFTDPDAQSVARPRGHHAAPGPGRGLRNGIRVGRRPRERTLARRSGSRRAPEEHGSVAPLPSVERRRHLARLVCRLHGGGASRERSAGLTDLALTLAVAGPAARVGAFS